METKNQTQETEKKPVPRIVDESADEREPVVKIVVKESTIDAALKFIQKALAASKGKDYKAATVKGTLTCFGSDEE